jgi:hypothetical protein
VVVLYGLLLINHSEAASHTCQASSLATTCDSYTSVYGRTGKYLSYSVTVPSSSTGNTVCCSFRGYGGILGSQRVSFFGPRCGTSTIFYTVQWNGVNSSPAISCTSTPSSSRLTWTHSDRAS